MGYVPVPGSAAPSSRMKESNIAREILLAASKQGHRLFINARGMAYTRNGNPIRFGLGANGSSDLIGWTRDGLFAAIEVKKPKGSVIRSGQPEFVAAVIQAGGRAGIVRSVDEALAVLNAPPGPCVANRPDG